MLQYASLCFLPVQQILERIRSTEAITDNVKRLDSPLMQQQKKKKNQLILIFHIKLKQCKF